MVYVEPEIQEQIIKLHIVEGRTYKSLNIPRLCSSSANAGDFSAISFLHDA